MHKHMALHDLCIARDNMHVFVRAVAAPFIIAADNNR